MFSDPVTAAGAPLSSSLQIAPSDSESEVEPRYTRRLDCSFSVRRNSSDNESVKSSWSSVSKRTSGLRYGSLHRSSTTQHELRRSLEIADTSTLEFYRKDQNLVPYQTLATLSRDKRTRRSRF